MVLQPAVGATDHVGVEAGAGHDREPLAVHADRVDAPARAVQPGHHGPFDVFRQPQVGREQVGRPGRDDGHRRVGSGQHVHTALRHAIPAPHEEQVDTLREQALDLLRRLAALVHLGPERVADAVRGERAAKLGQAAVERLARVCDDADPVHAAVVRLVVAASAARAAATATTSAPTPTRTARGHIRRVVHAAVHAREPNQQRDDDGDRPAGDPRPARTDPGGDQQRQSAVDRDGRRRVAREVAGVGGQVVEPRHVRPLAVDCEGRDPVGGCLDCDRGDDERGHPPAAHDQRQRSRSLRPVPGSRIRLRCRTARTRGRCGLRCGDGRATR